VGVAAVEPARVEDGFRDGTPCLLAARSTGLVVPGDRLVITAGTAVNIPGSTNVIKVDIA
jgi:pyruvate kinase